MSTTSMAYCDLAVREVWHSQTEALFDFRVCNADAQSYANRPVTAVLDSLAQAKTTKHVQACWLRRADFTDTWREGQHCLHLLAFRLANKWSKSYSTTMSFVHTQLSLAILQQQATVSVALVRRCCLFRLKMVQQCRFL